MSLMDKMMTKIDEIGSSLDGYKVSNRVLDYLKVCESVREFSNSIMKQTSEHHLAFAPMINTLFMTDGSTDPRLWLMVYEDLLNDSGMPDVPVEVMLCTQLSLKGKRLYYKGVQEMINDDGEMYEHTYGLALAGIEEDWWEHDDLASLPPRDKHAAKAMAATSMMDGMMDEIMSMFDADDGPDEGWFV